MILVVAGSTQQFKEFARTKAKELKMRINEFKYILCTDRIRGSKDCQLFFVGTYYDKSDIDYDYIIDYCGTHNIEVM